MARPREWNSSHTDELKLELEVGVEEELDWTWNDWFEKDEVEPEYEVQVLELEAEQRRVELEVELEVVLVEDFERNSDETLTAVDSRSGGRAGFFGVTGLEITCVVTFSSADVGVV